MKNTLSLILLFTLVLSTNAFGQVPILEPADVKTEPKPQVEPLNEPEVEVFKVVEEMPYFKGCNEALNARERTKCGNQKMLEFVYSNLKYPTEAREQGVEGMVIVRFVVEKDGSITEPEVIRDIGAGCGEEALRVIRSMPNWNPGKMRGAPVRVYFNMPLRFKLESTPPPPPTKPEKEPKEVFKVVDQMPYFSGCEDVRKRKRKACADRKMLKYIYKNIRYPAYARKKGVEGMVVIQFIVEKDGSITNPKIQRDIGGGCGEEALRIIKLMPKWNPGLQDGKPVAVQFNLPVRFKLGRKTKKKIKMN